MNEMTNAVRKLVVSLDRAKQRKDTGLFKVEGTKCVLEAIGNFKLKYLIATSAWLDEHPVPDCEVIKVSSDDMERISSFPSPAPVIGVFYLPEPKPLSIEHGLIVALDCVQDPGNLGTIIRVCDWMGVKTILAGAGTADAFAPKVVQAAMGAIARVNIQYCDLYEALKTYEGNIYGTFLKGDNLYTTALSDNAVIVMGNEGNGISDQVASLITQRLTIPSYPPGEPTSESLNVAVATAITLAMVRSRS